METNKLTRKDFYYIFIHILANEKTWSKKDDCWRRWGVENNLFSISIIRSPTLKCLHFQALLNEVSLIIDSNQFEKNFYFYRAPCCHIQHWAHCTSLTCSPKRMTAWAKKRPIITHSFVLLGQTSWWPNI
jgi:hypothetical protein